MASANADVKYCVVCGMGSHRTDWINKSGDYVACDNHSAVQMKDAIAATASSTAAKPPAKPQAPPPPPAVTSPATPPAAESNVVVK